MTAQGYFIAGTDTGVGKTLVTGALLLHARAQGRSAIGLKPVAAGCTLAGGHLVNDDALLLQSLSSRAIDYADVNPVALEPALAPHIAAERAGTRLDATSLATHVGRIVQGGHDVVLVEGAGGWLVPLNGRETMADLAARIGWPVILVVGMRIGCLNHALLTASAIDRSGLGLAGWVANRVDPAMEAFDDNVRSLEQRLPGPRLGTVPYLGAAAAPAMVNTWLDGISLLGVR